MLFYISGTFKSEHTAARTKAVREVKDDERVEMFAYLSQAVHSASEPVAGQRAAESFDDVVEN